MDVVPAAGEGNKLTPRQYRDRWLAEFEAQTGQRVDDLAPGAWARPLNDNSAAAVPVAGCLAGGGVAGPTINAPGGAAPPIVGLQRAQYASRHHD